MPPPPPLDPPPVPPLDPPPAAAACAWRMASAQLVYSARSDGRWLRAYLYAAWLYLPLISPSEAQSRISRLPSDAVESKLLAGASRQRSAVRSRALRMKRCGDGGKGGGGETGRPPSTRAVTVSSLPAPGRRLQRAADARGPRLGGVGADVRAALGAPARAQAGVVVQAPDGAREPAGDGADGIGCDHRQSLVHGFVDDEPPWLAKGTSRNRRYDHNVCAPVEVADLHRRGRPLKARRPGGPGPGSLRAGAYQD